jgi:chromosome segregation ATPase
MFSLEREVSTMEENRRKVSDARDASEAAVGRREALGLSALAVLGVVAGSALGGEAGRDARSAIPEEMRRRLEESQAYMDRMRDAGPEERRALMRERMATRNQQAIANLKEPLGCSDAEWQVVKPRVEAVYNLVHPLPQAGGDAAASRSELDQKMQELREVLAEKDADVDRIKAKLTAARAAKEKADQKLAAARQTLRQLMTVRQEATLVVNGLLD